MAGRILLRQESPLGSISHSCLRANSLLLAFSNRPAAPTAMLEYGITAFQAKLLFGWPTESPLEKNSSGVITIDSDGNLVVLAENGTLVWSSNASLSGRKTSAVLLESGNLVLKDETEIVLWQSFDLPTDTYMFGMEFRLNLTTGETRGLVSWKAESDPSLGEYSMKIDPVWPSQVIIEKGSQRFYRWGPWDIDLMKAFMARERGFNVTIYTVKDMLISSLNLINSSVVSRIVLTPRGTSETQEWFDSSKSWNLVASTPQKPCGYYQQCGPFGMCSSATSPECQCVDGYVPLRREDWEKGNWSAGCVQRAPLACNDTGGFIKLERMKLPDFPNSMGSISISECESQCLQNCSCRGYTLTRVVFGPSPRCLIWTGNMVDLESNNTMGQDLYIRLASSELGARDPYNGGFKSKDHRETILLAVLLPAAFIGILIFILLGYFTWTRVKRQEPDPAFARSIPELPFFNFSSILAATENFSEENKLGKGGFGPVYKGKLLNGQEVAIKRLSRDSGQGLEEFKNEVELIAKLQHKNLVRLLGWCIHEEEKILLYEFMPNKSLDKFLFESTGEVKLGWNKRFHIAQDIAQGLLYLHRYSRLRIIHRDLKASNILLDSEMNPKISDFGLARIFEGNQTEANTRRVVGTYGYMAPEYALDGIFSEKSDVFSFGVLLLEIVSGKKSKGLYPSQHSVTLLGYVWSLWSEDRTMELIDPLISDSFVAQEVARCIQVGLLCVQERAADRPKMLSVVSMLVDENTVLPTPQQPAFFFKRDAVSGSTSASTVPSQNEITLSVVDPR